MLEFRTLHLRPRVTSKVLTISKPSRKSDSSVEVVNVAALDLESIVLQGTEESEVIAHNKHISVTANTNQKVIQPLHIQNVPSDQSRQVLATLNASAKPGLGQDPEQRCFLSLVTPYSVVFKVGRASSLVWVTDAHTGEVVPNAKVTIVETTGLRMTTVYESLTKADGTASIALPSDRWFKRQTSRSIFDRNFEEREILSPRQRECIELFETQSAALVAGPKGTSLLPLTNRFRTKVGAQPATFRQYQLSDGSLGSYCPGNLPSS